MAFYEVIINRYEDIKKSNLHEDWIFRGQTQDWVLKSSLERFTDKRYLALLGRGLEWKEKFLELEKKFLTIFKNKATNFISFPEKRLESTTLMQHYGLPTRLIDFSKVSDIAAYFATEKNNCDYENSVIWGINISKLSKKKFVVLDLYDEQLIKNLRFKKKNGKFLLSTDYTFNLNKNNFTKKDISEINFTDCAMIKFIIPSQVKNEIRDYLNKNNINEKYLFPKDKDEEQIIKICKEIKDNFKKVETCQFL
ncbi:MAG: FRG domain-containing protein [bacterium]